MNGSYSIDGYYRHPIVNEHFTLDVINDAKGLYNNVEDLYNDLLKKVSEEASATQKILDNQYNIAKTNTLDAITAINKEATDAINVAERYIDKNKPEIKFDCS